MTITEKLIQPGNFTPGRGGYTVKNIVLHTEDATDSSAWATFNDPSKQRSAHYLVGENGEVLHAVSEGDTAWHAANWIVNESSIGIEHEDKGNYNDPVRTDAEYANSAELVADICRRYGIPCVKVEVGSNHMPVGPGIVLHKEVSQSGTACPDGLDWARIIRQAQAILGGVTPSPTVVPTAAIVADHPGYTELNQAVTVNWNNLQVRVDADPNSDGNQANTPDGMLHAGNTITITGWKRGVRVNQNGVDSDVWLRSVWGHWLFAGGTNFPLDTVGALAPVATPAPVAEPVPAPVVAATPEPAPQAPTPAPADTVAPSEPSLQSGIESWSEHHEVLYTNHAGVTVDTLNTGAKTTTFAAGQRVDKSGVFVVAGKSYVRTEYGLEKGTWIGIPLEVFTDTDPNLVPSADPIPDPVAPAAAPGPAVDGIAKSAPVSTSIPVSAVPSASSLTLRARLIQAIAALVGGGADVTAAVTKIFSRKK